MNSIAVSDGTAPPSDGSGHHSTLKKRVLSSLVLGPVALGALFAGGAWFVAMVLVMVSAMAWEWRRLCTGGQFDLAGWLFTIGVLASVGAVPFFGLTGALGAGAVVAAVVGLAAKIGGDRNTAWSVAGVVAIAVTGIALVWLRAHPTDGLGIVLWLLVAVWFTDCCAYFTGRRIGGPKLAPAISPGKTWSGLAGGVIGAAGWSAGYASVSGSYDPLALAGAGAVIAVLAQAGDLGVSRVKRRFGAKDSSHLIPGHGGVLDRVDGFILSVPAVMIALAPWSEGAGR
ncbi:MAG: phosphatidate cytidylyltransferase [Alphaproteobacteria bacterium]